jgi:hypothetical protein
VRSLCSDRQSYFCSWECRYCRFRHTRRPVYFVDRFLSISTGKLQVVAEPLSFFFLVLSFFMCFVFSLRRFEHDSSHRVVTNLLITTSSRTELAGFLCNTYLRRCDIVGSGNPECFGINSNASEIHRCCSNPDRGQPEDDCFAESPKGDRTVTSDVCCTPGVRYGMLCLFSSPGFVPCDRRFWDDSWAFSRMTS